MLLSRIDNFVAPQIALDGLRRADAAGFLSHSNVGSHAVSLRINGHGIVA
jgi:hypothetical protein